MHSSNKMFTLAYGKVLWRWE